MRSARCQPASLVNTWGDEASVLGNRTSSMRLPITTRTLTTDTEARETGEKREQVLMKKKPRRKKKNEQVKSAWNARDVHQTNGAIFSEYFCVRLDICIHMYPSKQLYINVSCYFRRQSCHYILSFFFFSIVTSGEKFESVIAYSD